MPKGLVDGQGHKEYLHNIPRHLWHGSSQERWESSRLAAFHLPCCEPPGPSDIHLVGHEEGGWVQARIGCHCGEQHPQPDRQEQTQEQTSGHQIVWLRLPCRWSLDRRWKRRRIDPVGLQSSPQFSSQKPETPRRWPSIVYSALRREGAPWSWWEAAGRPIRRGERRGKLVWDKAEHDEMGLHGVAECQQTNYTGYMTHVAPLRFFRDNILPFQMQSQYVNQMQTRTALFSTPAQAHGKWSCRCATRLLCSLPGYVLVAVDDTYKPLIVNTS